MYGLAFIVQLLILVPYAIRALHFKPTTRAIVERILDMVVHAAPPGVPAIMVFCTGARMHWLEQMGVSVQAPGALKMSGQTDIVAFDKTGTLTGSLVGCHLHCCQPGGAIMFAYNALCYIVKNCIVLCYIVLYCKLC